MPLKIRTFFLLFSLICLPRGAFAGTVTLISPAELSLQLSSVTVVDARDMVSFRKGHLPNSQRMGWQDWTVSKPGIGSWLINNSKNWGKVVGPSPKVQERLRNLGLSNNRLIVVVGQPLGWGEEGRIAWNLLYWGADHVALLDGGFPAWEKALLPIEKGDARFPEKGNFIIQVQEVRRASMPDVMRALETNDRVILDARSVEEFQGRKMFGQKKGGHLPGALSIPVSLLYSKDGTFSVPPTPAQSTIAYCVGGVRSALLALLIEIKTGKIVANYDGSMWEWTGPTE